MVRSIRNHSKVAIVAHGVIRNRRFKTETRTCDSQTTVMHFGDADALDEHFAIDPGHWQKRQTHFAMPPYWFLFSNEGRKILEDRVGALHSIGMHVPTGVPDPF